MKSKSEVKEIAGFPLLEAPVKESKVSHNSVGRRMKYPLFALKKGKAFFIPGAKTTNISPLVNYYQKSHQETGFHTRTFKYEGKNGVLVFRDKVARSKELVAAN